MYSRFTILDEQGSYVIVIKPLTTYKFRVVDGGRWWWTVISMTASCILMTASCILNLLIELSRHVEDSIQINKVNLSKQ